MDHERLPTRCQSSGGMRLADEPKERSSIQMENCFRSGCLVRIKLYTWLLSLFDSCRLQEPSHLFLLEDYELTSQGLCSVPSSYLLNYHY
jgi:hypothetical protein